MKLQKHIYQKDKIVIGGCLSALLYAYKNDLTVMFANPKPPFRYDKIEKDYICFWGLSLLNPTIRDNLEKITFLTGLSGNLPLSDNAAGFLL